MGVSIGFSGAVQAEQVRRDFLEWAAATARDMDWTSRPVEMAFKKARLRAGARKSFLEMPSARGLSFLPHFACEELPIVFVENDGTLVEELVQDSGSDAPTLLGGAIVKTQFAGAPVHREICELLGGVKQRFAPDLAIDDESGYFATHDEAALQRAFAEGWDEIRAKVRADRHRAGSRFQIGEFPFEVPLAPAGEELADLGADDRGLLLAADQACIGSFGGFGTTLDHSPASILDLELAISDVDEPGYRKDPARPEIATLALQSGAYFGRTVVAVLGGAWRSEDDRLVVADVGRSGLIVDPFQVARDRILNGPPFSFIHHLEVYERLATNLAREVSS